MKHLIDLKILELLINQLLNNITVSTKVWDFYCNHLELIASIIFIIQIGRAHV